MNENRNRNPNRNEIRHDGMHLTANEISRWLVEGPDLAAGRHLQSCSACRNTLAEAQEPLTVFRTALVGWSEAQSDAQPLAAQTLVETKRNGRNRLWLPAAGFAVAALLLVGYTEVPRVFHGHATGLQDAGLTSTPDSDAALLDQVDVEVSEAVPDAMAPLTDLVAWDSNSNSQAIPAEKPVLHKKIVATDKSKVESTN